MTEVSKERVRLLVEALRSEDYNQGQSRLHRIRPIGDGAVEETWCCLGVASDVAARNGLEIARKLVTDGYAPDGIQKEVFGSCHSEYLSIGVQEWYGFMNNDPDLLIADNSSEKNSAASLNDTGEDFEFIADAFERTFLKEESNAS